MMPLRMLNLRVSNKYFLMLCGYIYCICQGGGYRRAFFMENLEEWVTC